MASSVAIARVFYPLERRVSPPFLRGALGGERDVGAGDVVGGGVAIQCVVALRSANTRSTEIVIVLVGAGDNVRSKVTSSHAKHGRWE